jgi:hypothetical protein
MYVRAAYRSMAFDVIDGDPRVDQLRVVLESDTVVDRVGALVMRLL